MSDEQQTDHEVIVVGPACASDGQGLLDNIVVFPALADELERNYFSFM